MSDEPNSGALIRPGLRVMVQAGVGAAVVNNHLPIVCMGEVMGPAPDHEDTWWVSVWMGQAEGLPQMYRADEILGTPSLGITYRPVIST